MEASEEYVMTTLDTVKLAMESGLGMYSAIGALGNFVFVSLLNDDLTMDKACFDAVMDYAETMTRFNAKKMEFDWPEDDPGEAKRPESMALIDELCKNYQGHEDDPDFVVSSLLLAMWIICRGCDGTDAQGFLDLIEGNFREWVEIV